MATFPDQVPGLIYPTEGGQATEVRYRPGFDLPELAMFPLPAQPDAAEVMRSMFETGVVPGGGVWLRGARGKKRGGGRVS